EYRSQLRLELKRYVAWHARQVPKPSRSADAEFFAFHSDECDRILIEADHDPAVRAAMLAVRALLSRGRLLRGVQRRLSE
nr:hypothetical protein [Actinomycetota bacterium]